MFPLQFLTIKRKKRKGRDWEAQEGKDWEDLCRVGVLDGWMGWAMASLYVFNIRLDGWVDGSLGGEVM